MNANDECHGVRGNMSAAMNESWIKQYKQLIDNEEDEEDEQLRKKNTQKEENDNNLINIGYENFYSERYLSELEDADGISPEEEGFMRGYDNAI
jgi:hypothetical protein